MPYKSIVRLLEYCNIETIPLDIGKIKKILSAEFSLSDNGVISIDGFDYTLNDAFTEMEHPDFPMRLEYHYQIWEYNTLLYCLEKHTVDFRNTRSWNVLAEDPEFVRFVSPYFAEAFDIIMRRYLNPLSLGDAGEWMKRFFLIDNAEDEDIATKSLRSYLTGFIHRIKNVNGKTFVSISSELGDWITQPCYILINNLPNSLYKVKDELTRALVNLTVLLQDSDKNLAYGISSFLTSFTGIDDDLRRLIFSNHEIFVGAIGRDGKKRKIFSGWWSYLLIGFIIIRIAVICSSPGKHSTENSNGESISSGYYEGLRIKYRTIDAGGIGEANRDLLNTHNLPYYFMFECTDSISPLVLNIINQNGRSQHFYLKPPSSAPVRLIVDAGDSVRIITNRHIFDLLLSNTNNPFTFAVVPVLVSDRINYYTHKFQPDSDVGRVIIDKCTTPFGQDDITLRLISRPNEQGFPQYIIRFSGADWVTYRNKDNPEPQGEPPTQ
jgi:hypothetical protein